MNTPGAIKNTLRNNGFDVHKTWGDFLARKDTMSFFAGKDGFYMLSKDYGSGNGTTCLLQGALADLTQEALKNALGVDIAKDPTKPEPCA